MPYWTMTFDGLACRVSAARQFALQVVGDVLGADAVVLVTSELAGNAVQHSRSGQPGGQFTLHVAAYGNRWCVRVDDAGGPTEPLVGRADSSRAEAGRGLALVSALASDWGVLGDHYARAVWAEIPRPGGEESGSEQSRDTGFLAGEDAMRVGGIPVPGL